MDEPSGYKDIRFTFNQPQSRVDKNNKLAKIYSQDSIVNIGGCFYKFRCNSIGDTLTILTVNSPRNAPLQKQKNEFLNFSGLDINNKTFKFNDLHDKFVLIDFWGPWCKPCLQSIPTLKKCFNSYDTSKFAIVSIAWDNKLEKVKNFVVKSDHNRWTNLFEDNTTPPEGKLSFKLKITDFPTYFLINNKGEVVAKEVGLENLSKIVKILDESNLKSK